MELYSRFGVGSVIRECELRYRVGVVEELVLFKSWDLGSDGLNWIDSPYMMILLWEPCA